MKIMNNFKTFSELIKEQQEEKRKIDKLDKQIKWSTYFLELLQEYDIASPDELSSDELKEFLDKVIYRGMYINEKKINSDDEFREYAKLLLKKAHGKDYDEKRAEEVINGLLSDRKKNGWEYGKIVGILQSSLGK